MSQDSSGLDDLLEALKQSGVDVDNMGSGSRSSDPVETHATVEQTHVPVDKEGKSSSKNQKSERRARAAQNRQKDRDRTGDLLSTMLFGGAGAGGSSGGGSNKPPIDVELENPFKNVGSWGKRQRIVGLCVAILILAALYWWFHPPISINSTDTWMFIAVFLLLPFFLYARAKSRTYEKGSKTVDPNAAKQSLFKKLSYIPIIIAVCGLLGGVLSLSFIPGNAQKYANILQTEPLDFATDIPEVDYSQIPIIDHDSAELLGNREMGSIPEYVSQFEISPLYSQINYQGKPVRVSPLGYADLFKWFTNRSEGIPAYVLVNMTTQNSEVVRLPEGQGMKYTHSEPLARNIDRYVQLKYPFYIFDEKSFEIDEDGVPWWICPVRKYTIGLFGGETVNRVVMCNAATGECQDMAVEDVPQWADRVYPSELLVRQYNWSGLYINGWFNSWLGQSGVYQTTPGLNGRRGFNYIAKDDDVWVYTGVTSATADNSIIGFVLINQRTAESHFYSVPGATEDSAMASAEGQVQNLRYSATFPLLINVANQPTYFMALKDGAGLVKQFAMIDIQRYQNAAVGSTVAGCQESYEALLATNGILSDEQAASKLDLSQTDGRIKTMAQATVGGNSHFYLTLEGDDGIYDFVLPALISIVTYGPGDNIYFTYAPGDPVNTAQEILDASGNVESGGISAVAAAEASEGESVDGAPSEEEVAQATAA